VALLGQVPQQTVHERVYGLTVDHGVVVVQDYGEERIGVLFDLAE